MEFSVGPDIMSDEILLQDLRGQWEDLGRPEVIAVRGEEVLYHDGEFAVIMTVHAAPDDWDKPGTGYTWNYRRAAEFGLTQENE